MSDDYRDVYVELSMTSTPWSGIEGACPACGAKARRKFYDSPAVPRVDGGATGMVMIGACYDCGHVWAVDWPGNSSPPGTLESAAAKLREEV